MFRTKKDVDKHCQEVFRNIKGERERNLRCLSIAQQYYNVRDYESAKQYVELYLSVKEDSSVGRKLLAQCYECLQEKEKALIEFKYSLQLDPKQPELILRVCELLAENCVTFDKNEAKYWQDKAETHFPYHPSIFKLKQKLSALGDKTDVNSVESIIMDEVAARPDDPAVNTKLLSFLIETGRIQDAYDRAFTKIPLFIPTLQWYQNGVQICKLYKTQFPNTINEDFYGNYLFVLERAVALSVQDVKIFRKSIPECIEDLARFDEVLSATASLPNRSDNFILLVNHMAGQLCYHKANILYRKIKWEENNMQDVNQFIAPLLLLSTSETFTINKYRKQNTVIARILDQCSQHNTYRISQAGLVLLSRCKSSQRKNYLESIFRFCVANWREKISEKLFCTSYLRSLIKSSFFVNYAAFANIPVDLPRGLIENVEQFVGVTEATQKASLHHLVWLGIQYLINSEKQTICDRLLPLKFRSVIFGCPQYPPKPDMALVSAETLTKIDADAFLYACVYCAESALRQSSQTSNSSSIQILPADVSKPLCSPEQELWWESAYQVAGKSIPKDNFARVRKIVQHGIEEVRLMENYKLPLPLLVLLGRTFVNRAAIEPNEDLAYALEARALHYWKAALSLLHKITRDESYSYKILSMFDYFGPAITKSEAVTLFNEGKRFHEMTRCKKSNYADNFTSSYTTAEFDVNTSSTQASSSGFHATSVVDEKILCSLFEQNAKIINRLDTLFSKQELLSSNQLQLYDMVSVLAKKIDVFVIDSLTQAVQPLSPQNTAVAATTSAPQFSVPSFNPLGVSSPSSSSCQFPFPTGNTQTNFPMYHPTFPPSLYTTPAFDPAPYLPQLHTSFTQPSLPIQQPIAPTFDFRGGLPTSSLTPNNRAVTEFPKITTASITSSLSIGSPLSGLSLGLVPVSTEVRTTPARSSIFSSQNSTPTSILSNASPSHSFQIKLPEFSSIIKSPSVKIPEENADSDDEKKVVEHDPIPDFKPIIPLPDEITVTTGEENEEVLFESRAKLFRYVEKEWKERGIGMFKILKDRDTGRIRILMRREIVHKICANHFLSGNMTLSPMFNSDRAWVYCAPDFSNEQMVIEKLCVKFKTPEIAREFEQSFNKYKALNDTTSTPNKSRNTTPAAESPSTPALTNGPAAPTSAVSPPVESTNKFSKKIIVSPASLNVDRTEKAETGSTSRVEKFPFQSATTGVTKPETESKSNFGGFSFNSTPIFTPLEKEKPKTEEKPKSSPFTSFSFNSNGESFKPTSGTSLFSSITTTKTTSDVPKQSSDKDTPLPFTPFSNAVNFSNFGAKSSVAPATETPKQKDDLKDASLSFASVRDTIDFSSLSKSSTSASAFVKSENFKGFAGAGSLVFNMSSPSRTAASPSSAVSAILKNFDPNDKASPTTEGANDSRTTEEEFVPTAEFQPVVPLPDLVEVKTGEEGMNLLYVEQCKLFRYVDKEWKERGIGKMKIFRDPSDGSTRMLMRRDQVHKVCCNQRITPDIELTPMKTNNKAWTWSNQDYSEGELKNELFCIRFKTQELAEAFKKVFENEQSKLSTPTRTSSAPSNTTETKPLPSLAEQFKRDPNSWECEVCYVRNGKEATNCKACTTPRDGATATETSSSVSAFGATEASTFGIPKTEFKFGMPATTSAATSGVFSFGNTNDSSKVIPTTPGAPVFNFGPSTTTNASTAASNPPMFNFGNSAAPVTISSGLSGSPFSFESSNSKSVSGGSLFGCSPADESTSATSKHKEISIFSGSPIKSTEPTSAFSSFSFKLGDSQVPQSTFTFGSQSAVNGITNQHTPLYKQVPLLIRDENDKLLFESRAKLLRFASGDWEARGIGRLKILRNVQFAKCRLFMLREPAGVVACLNHYLPTGVTFVAYDSRSWIWSASDFSEGEIIYEKFCLIFENDDDAKAFETTLKTVDSTHTNVKTSTDEVEFVSETQISEEDKKLAESLKLPSNYFAYKYSSKPCPGCAGCEQEDLQNNLVVNEFSEKLSTTVVSESAEPTNELTNKPTFVFGAPSNSSWSKGSFNFSNLFTSNDNKDLNISKTSKSDGVVEREGSEDEEVVTNENDPHFEPIVPLPDIVDTKTGEEDEKLIFQERAKIFRYDEDKKEWKERGIGDLKLLHHPTQNTYRLLLRREQVHKVVLNQRLMSSFTLQPLSSSKNSVCWFGMNFSEETNASALEKLAARFKSEEIMSRFEEAVNSCVSQLTNSQANGIDSDSRVNEICSAEHENIEGVNADENDSGCRNDDYDVEEYDEQRDYVDEQGIEDAMQDYYDYANENSIFKNAAVLRIVEDDVDVDYTGDVKIIMHVYSECDQPAAYVDFSSEEIPSLYSVGITKETIVIPEGNTVTFPIANESEHECNSKAVLHFENENLAQNFYDIICKIQLCDTDSITAQQDA